MRALLDQDVDLALLCLLALPPAQRLASLTRWLAEAHMADKIRKRLQRAHAHWGDGTLAGRLRHVPRKSVLRRHDAESLAALHDLAGALDLWRRGQAAQGQTARGTMV